MSIADDVSSEYAKATATEANSSHVDKVDKGKGKMVDCVARNFGLIVENEGIECGQGGLVDDEVVEQGPTSSRKSTPAHFDFGSDDAITKQSSRPTSEYSSVDTPGAGPSNSSASTTSSLYNTTSGNGSRRSLRFENSKTSFLDVTEQVSNISKYPVSEGAFCDVHEAHMEGVGKVALKRLRLLGNESKVRKRFRYEAEIWCRLSHPNVLRLYGLYLDGPALYMVSPWQANGPLSTYVKRNPEADKLMLLQQVAAALAYLHSNDPVVIHGDVKGQNVLISHEGNAILCDFGLSMILAEISGISQTPSGVQDGGSTRYMAPELMQGVQPKTQSSDTYAFALLMIEVFSGSHPFPNLRYDANLITAIISGERPPCPLNLGVGRVRTKEEIRNECLWRLIQICWHSRSQFRPIMSYVDELLREIGGITVMRSCKLKEFVIAGNLDVEGYVLWISQVRLGDTSIKAKSNLQPYNPQWEGRESDTPFASLDCDIRERAWSVNVQNPINWPFWRKGIILGILLSFNLLASISNTIVAPALPQIAAHFGISYARSDNLALSAFTIGLLCGPLFFLPLSETFGQLWVFHAGATLLAAFNFSCAYAPSFETFIIFRFLAGLGGSVMSVSTAILVDIFDEQRGVSISSTIVFFLGTSIGGILGGVLTEKAGPRWPFLFAGSACGVIGLLGTVFLKETLPRLVRIRAERREVTEQEDFPATSDIDLGRTQALQAVDSVPWHFSWSWRLKFAMTSAWIRPFQLCFTNPMYFILTQYVALLSGIHYSVLVSFPTEFQRNYAFSVGETGLAYLSPSIGILLSVGMVAFLHRVYCHLSRKNDLIRLGSTARDPRLLVLMCSALTVPIGLFIYGWTLQNRTHFTAPIIGVGFFAFTMAAVSLSVQYYLLDVTKEFDAVASTVAIARFVFGSAFPLFEKQFRDGLGNGAGYSILAGLTILLGVVAPLIAFIFKFQRVVDV